MFKLFVQFDEQSCYSSHTTSSAAGNFRSRPSVSFAIPSFDDDCDGGFTMAKGRRPPPLNLNIDARPRSLPRISRTPACKEATPLLTPLPEDDYEDPPEPIVRAVRIAVDFMHLVACMMLVLMMAIFLATSSQAMTSSYGTKALLLMIALAGDVLLDMRSINLHDRSWSDWALVARSLSSSVYLGILISFLAAEQVFPADYTYWNLVPEEAGEPVLALLCVILHMTT
ncbi:hypothetical protein EDB81DRAFT_188293 [Dactylonectria macrodidyma]|uniref:Uncharacterized protein n=1 Tax=Dactylonectria macrodidyma TaxID=307937 RepID=A0A9P9JH95_9HYPO|nr:hypothetical protein EDB81DRAFT_188293 [Dactylonectria macrodidyma]